MGKKVVKKKVLKKIVRNQSKTQKFFRKHGLFLILFFLCSILYFTWLYGVPALLDQKITPDKISEFTLSKIGFKTDFKDIHFYTTPTLDVGIKMKDLKLFYPRATSFLDEKELFLKARAATIEIPFIPYLLKTIRFNEFSLRSVNVDLYQNEKGHYAYIENLKSNFNPQMQKYILELPTIQIISYSMNNYNKKTNKFQRLRDNELKLTPSQIKNVLQEAPNSKTIMLR